jgi:hypothetical protein
MILFHDHASDDRKPHKASIEAALPAMSCCGCL